MSEKIKAMRGSEERSEEVRGWIKSQGAKDLRSYTYQDPCRLYFVGPDNIADCILDDYALLVDIVELPEKPAVYFKPYDKVLVRDVKTKNWICDVYSHYRFGSAHPYICIGGSWSECIPYEGNEHLVGKVN